MQQMITVLDFDDLYDKEEFYQSAPHQRINLREVPGPTDIVRILRRRRSERESGQESHLIFIFSVREITTMSPFFCRKRYAGILRWCCLTATRIFRSRCFLNFYPADAGCGGPWMRWNI